jgi:hypothetical protein
VEKSRWWWVGYGVVNVIVGLLALAWPGATIVVLAIVFAVQLFVLGILEPRTTSAPDAARTAPAASAHRGGPCHARPCGR